MPSDQRSVELWNLSDRAGQPETVQHNSKISRARLSRDGKYFFSESVNEGETTIRIWNTSDVSPARPPIELSGELAEAAFVVQQTKFENDELVDETTFVTIHKDGKVRHFDVNSVPTKGTEWELGAGGYERLIQLSPDGRIALTEYSDDPRATCYCRSIFSGDGGGISARNAPSVSHAFNDKSHLLLLGFSDSSAKLYGCNVSEGDGSTVSLSFFGDLAHEREVNTVAFGVDHGDGYRGQFFLTATDYDVQVWATATMGRVGRPMRLDTPVQAAGFTPDGSSIFVVSDDVVRIRSADIVDVDRTNLRYSVEDKGPAFNALKLSPDGENLVAHSNYDHSVAFFNIVSGNRIGKRFRIVPPDTPAPDFKAGQVEIRAISSNGNCFVTSQYTPTHLRHGESEWRPESPKTLRLWSVDGEQLASTVLNAPAKKSESSDEGNAEIIAIDPSGSFVALSNSISTLIWNVKKEEVHELLHDASAMVSAMAFDGTGERLAIGYTDGTSSLCRSPFRESTATNLNHLERIDCLSFDSAGDVLLTAGGSRIRTWRLPMQESTGFNVTHKINGLAACVFSPDGQIIAAAGGNVARLFDTATKQALGPPMPHLQSRFPEQISAIAFNQDGTSLTCQANSLYSWRVPSHSKE